MTLAEIKQLQRALRETVAPNITVDGLFGNQTTQAIQLYANAHNTNTEGAMKLLQDYIAMKYLNPQSYIAAAQELTVPVSYVHAISQVETAGDSFLSDGRVKILFERHWFYRKLKEALTASSTALNQVAKLVLLPGQQINVDSVLAGVVKKYNNICDPDHGGYQGGAAEWDRLNLAMTLDVEAACLSASYGAYQVMGFNYKACGYASAHDMMVSLQDSETKQLLAMVAFVKSEPGMHQALKAGNWAKFASLYNGPKYAENSYDTKLAKAEEDWHSANVA